jgi:hypothetical protein
MLDLQISVDLADIQAALKDLSDGNFPRTREAVRDATFLVQKTWLQAASGREVTYQGRTFSVKRISGDYARSIEHGLSYPDGGDEMAGRVTADTPYAQAIEDGSPPRDMKPGFLAGPKARRAKDGSIYAIIPFRHGTPGATTLKAMPAEVYQEARQLAYSRITGRRHELNAHGVPVQRNTYRWGGRLGDMGPGAHRKGPYIKKAGAPFLEPGVEDKSYTHTTSIHSGMVRMGSSKNSQFMTFRVVSSKSPANSWWSRGTEPRPIAAAVAEMVEPHALMMIRAAFTADLQDIGDE